MSSITMLFKETCARLLIHDVINHNAFHGAFEVAAESGQHGGCFASLSQYEKLSQDIKAEDLGAGVVYGHNANDGSFYVKLSKNKMFKAVEEIEIERIGVKSVLKNRIKTETKEKTSLELKTVKRQKLKRKLP